jgi:serine/threonine protein kinase
LQEVRILRELRHTSICSFLGTCMQQGLPAIVLECLPGGSLYNLLHEAPGGRAAADGSASAVGSPTPLAPELLSRLSLEVAQGVAYLHQSQVIHRDIKSANVLLDAHQHAKVTDFGISTRFALDHTAETGTYRYMAPEVIAHQQYDYRCDVYSYGMLLWEIAHQQVPFRSQNALQAAFAVAMEQKRPPLGLSVALAGFGPVITACWQSSAEQRPDMDRVVQQLQALDEAVAAAAAPPPPPGGASCVVALLPPEQAATTSTDGQGAELAAVATSRTLPSWDGGMAGAPTGFDSCNP